MGFTIPPAKFERSVDKEFALRDWVRRSMSLSLTRLSSWGMPTGIAGHSLLRNLEQAFDYRFLVLRLAVIAVLLVSTLLDSSTHHRTSHWIMLAAYCLSGFGVAALSRIGRTQAWLPWVGTILDALITVYVIAEHLPRDVHDAHHATDALSLLPALLFLLQTGLSLRENRILLFSGLVITGWGLSLGSLLIEPGNLVSGEGTATFISRQAQGFIAFIAAALFVLGAVFWMRRTAATAWRERKDRLLISRFLPMGVAGDMLRGRAAVKAAERHACILSIDIRGFSALARDYPAKRTVFWLLAFRRIVHQAVSWHSGVVDKYMGDGVLALFLEGEPANQAENALAAARSIAMRFEAINIERLRRGDPPLRTIMALHCGEVLAGVFDDGHRAEFTVLGPPMNALSRIERRGKEADVDIVASLAFLDVLPAPARCDLGGERLTIDEPGLSELAVVLAR